jgi:hypothetical protein
MAHIGGKANLVTANGNIMNAKPEPDDTTSSTL